MTEELKVSDEEQVPKKVKDEVVEASASLKKLLDPKAKTPPEVRDTIEETVEPLTEALKILQDPKTPPEDRHTIEKIVKQLKIIIVEFPKTPPKEWHPIGDCVEQLKIIIVEFPKTPPDIRHNLGKIIGKLEILLPVISDQKIHQGERKIIEGAIPPLTGAMDTVRHPITSPKERDEIKKIVDRLGKGAGVIQNPTASPQDRNEAEKSIGQQTENLKREKERWKARHKGLFNRLSPEQQQTVTCTASLLLFVGTGGKSQIAKATLHAAAMKIAARKALTFDQQRAVDEARKLVDVVNSCALPPVEVWLDTLREAAKTDLVAAALYQALLHITGAECLASLSDTKGAFNGANALRGVIAAEGVYSKCGPAANEFSGRKQ
jgi:hypothetical protein